MAAMTSRFNIRCVIQYYSDQWCKSAKKQRSRRWRCPIDAQERMGYKHHDMAGHSLSKPEPSIHFHVWMFSLCLVTLVIMICEMGRNNTWWYLT